mmetsp:Transcript_17989/g.44933  ORF Transcript_17989/g.44933 Transcript_17989/m.44933 type:complete len:1292 (-) Transcript_17989:484-4359(-)|eukprot:CAMPEP_0178988504 /NCGR_PEP_ID=MMETSP0795-20121207/3845_1 /TAXON_ID=88552 /ORGANISM="Amoebophrya sp., Strain Ameob2" /LENGTH=1291 /DNA_ID=CAMNT_0020679781 /DNA_START=449 /DNA_END=4324 /DNA_ORIENTATION=+
MTNKSRGARRLRAREERQKQHRGRVHDSLTIVWLRDDMRFTDNHALSFGDRFLAPSSHSRILPVFIHNPADVSPWPLRGAGLWYKGKSLRTFAERLKTEFGVDLIVRFGAPADVLLALVAETGATRVVWNERYEPWYTTEDEDARARLLQVREGGSLRQLVADDAFWAEYERALVVVQGKNVGRRAGGDLGEESARTRHTAKHSDEDEEEDRLLALAISASLGEDVAGAAAQTSFQPAPRTGGPAELLAPSTSDETPEQPGEGSSASGAGARCGIDLTFASSVSVVVCPGSLLVAPWVADPEKNAEGWGFGSVQWMKKSICNIPAEHLLLPEQGFDQQDHDGDDQNKFSGTMNGSPRRPTEQAVDLEEYLRPLPRITSLRGITDFAHYDEQHDEQDENVNDQHGITKGKHRHGGTGSTIFSFSLDNLGYERTAGRGHPVSKKLSEKMREDPQYLSTSTPAWIREHREWNGGRFKQFNPRYYFDPGAAANIKAKTVVPVTGPHDHVRGGGGMKPPVAKLSNPKVEDWAFEMKKFWAVGEDAAMQRLETFCNDVLAEGLFEGRERFRADRAYTAMLSPYVRFGELSARSCFARGARVLGQVHLPEKGWRELRATFLRRFLWRDLAYWCLWRFPDLPEVSLRRQYETQKWWTKADDAVGTTAKATVLAGDKTSGPVVGGKNTEGDAEGAPGANGEQLQQIASTGCSASASKQGQGRNRFRRKKEDAPILSVKKEAAAKSGGSFAPSKAGGASAPLASSAASVFFQKNASVGGGPASSPRDKEHFATGPSAAERELLGAQRLVEPHQEFSTSAEQNKNINAAQQIDFSLQQRFLNRSSESARDRLRRWQRGKTGFPLVDAAMTQLWKIGWMPNYLRHIVAQFLVEYLDVSWKDGFEWFDYTLIDTDVSINAHMWQNGGHSGLDQWNFVMHPVFAAKSCDPEGNYVRRWLPELRALPVEYIHCPWEAPAKWDVSVLQPAGYPVRAILDLEHARRKHAENVLAVRKEFRKELVSLRGNEFLWLDCDYVTDWLPSWEKERREKFREKVVAWEAANALNAAAMRSIGGESVAGPTAPADSSKIKQSNKKKEQARGADVVATPDHDTTADSSDDQMNQITRELRLYQARQSQNEPRTGPGNDVTKSYSDLSRREKAYSTTVLRQKRNQPGAAGAGAVKNAGATVPKGAQAGNKNKANNGGNGMLKQNKAIKRQGINLEQRSSTPGVPAEFQERTGMMRRVELITRVDFREDSLDFLTVQTADKPRHFKKRELKNTWEQQIMTEVMGEWRRGGGVEIEDAL